MSDAYPVEVLEFSGYRCYVTKNVLGAWLAYVDVTECEELHVADFEKFDEVLPFHGRCTFCGWVKELSGLKFESERFLVGCDWCHGAFGLPAVGKLRPEWWGVEKVSLEEVKRNLAEVVEWLPELRLKMTVRGDAFKVKKAHSGKALFVEDAL